MSLSNDRSRGNLWLFLEVAGGCNVRILGRSMYPFFKKETSLFIKHSNAVKIKKNDIVLFENKKKGKVIAHRVVKLLGNRLITKGDNCEYCDSPPLSNWDIIAVVISFRLGARIIKRSTIQWAILTLYSVMISKFKRLTFRSYHAVRCSISKKV